MITAKGSRTIALLGMLAIAACDAMGQVRSVDAGKTQPAASIDMGNGYVVPGAAWEHVAPEAAGFSSARLEVVRSFMKTHQTAAAMVVYKGKVLFEYGDTAKSTNVASVRKSVLDILYGAELANLKDAPFDNYSTVVQLGLGDKVPFVHPEEMANLEHLLASRSGIYVSDGEEKDDAVSPRRGSEYPGAHFYYNNWDFNALGVVFERYTHKDIYDAVRNDLAGPLGMQDYDRTRQKKVIFPNGAPPLYPMWLSTRDMARLGVLMLSHGRWGDKQIADAGFLSWSTTLVTPSVEINPTSIRGVGLPARWGYGRLWWVWDEAVFTGNTIMGPYQGAYSAMGTGGQYITVFPAADLVVVHKVDIDAEPGANISPLAYGAVLDMVLDARCGDTCK